MLKNNRGEVFITLATLPGIIHTIGFGLALACLWHIPAWQDAKATGTTAQYQSQKMWPQQLFAKLPGGDNYKNNSVVTFPAPPVVGNGGNFPGGNSNPNFVQ